MIECVSAYACMHMCVCVSCVASHRKAGWAVLTAPLGVWAGGIVGVYVITPETWGREEECLFG